MKLKGSASAPTVVAQLCHASAGSDLRGQRASCPL